MKFNRINTDTSHLSEEYFKESYKQNAKEIKKIRKELAKSEIEFDKNLQELLRQKI
jgi:hypothetical protein